MYDSIKKFFKFYIVGLIAFWCDYGLLMLLSLVFQVHPVVAVGVAYVVTQVFNYMAMMRFVFTRPKNVSNVRGLLLFFLLDSVGLTFNMVVMWLGVSVLGDSAQVVTILKMSAQTLVMGWNFYSRKRWLDMGEMQDASSS